MLGIWPIAKRIESGEKCSTDRATVTARLARLTQKRVLHAVSGCPTQTAPYRDSMNDTSNV
jgi:hypothetical protein